MPSGEEWLETFRPLYGTYRRQTQEEADLRKAYQQLEMAGFKDSTEVLIMAAQE